MEAGEAEGKWEGGVDDGGCVLKCERLIMRRVVSQSVRVGEIEDGRVQKGVMLSPGTGGGVQHRWRKYHPRWLWRRRRRRGNGKMEWMREVEC